MDQKKIFIFLLSALVLLCLFKFIDSKNIIKKPTISRHILSLTQPVTSFIGIVEKKEDNKIVVTQTAPSKIAHTFLIDKNTSFLRPPVSIPFLFTTPIPTKEKIFTIDDIIVGSTVTVSVDTDLRLLKQPVFAAKNIFLTAAINHFTGKIINFGEKSIIVKDSKGNMITAIINDQTEISRYVHTPPRPNEPLAPVKPEKLTFADLKIDMEVTVYTDQDVLTGKDFTALRVEPMIPPTAISPSN